MGFTRRRRASWGYFWVVVKSLCVGTGAFFATPPTGREYWGQPSLARSPRAATKLNGVREWKEGQPGDLREIGFLPFPVDDVMCPGETKALHLYEARFLSLFENAIKHHGGCVGAAIFVDEGVLVRVGQLCDIVAWEREEVGVSVALRCIGRCEIKDVTNVDPYICATVREVRDVVGVDDPDEEGERNNVVSSDVFSLHRQCVELEGKMATAAGGDLGWEAGRRREQPGSSSSSSSSSQQSSRRRKRGETSDPSGASGGSQAELANDDEDDDEGGDDDGLFGGGIGAVFDPPSGANDGDDDGNGEDDLMARFQRGGGELDLNELDGGGGEWGESRAQSSGVAGEVEAVGRALGGGGRRVDLFADEDDEDDEDDEEEEEEGEEGKKELGDLLWGHESYESDGFDSSLEEQVEAMYDSLKADLSVSLEESRGGADAAAFGARVGANKNNDDKPWATGTPKTFAHVVAAAATASASGGSSGDGGEEGDGEGQFLWGCTSPQEERDQLLSFVSLGCFNPSARLQSLMLMSTGERLRMARAALAERLKVLVAKSALSQLGD